MRKKSLSLQLKWKFNIKFEHTNLLATNIHVWENTQSLKDRAYEVESGKSDYKS